MHINLIYVVCLSAFQDGDFIFNKKLIPYATVQKANCPSRLKLREVVAFPDYKVNNL